MIYKSTSFNIEYLLSFPDAESWAKAPANHTDAFWPGISEEERTKRLTDLYNKATNANGKPVPAVSPETTAAEPDPSVNGVDDNASSERTEGAVDLGITG